jgi:hypothetical protein
MRNSELEDKLTPAARQALDELVEAYRNQILIGAEQAASDSIGELREISVRDIFVSTNKEQAKDEGSDVEFFLWLLRSGGFGFAMAGLASLFIGLTDDSLSYPFSLGIAVIMTGILFILAPEILTKVTDAIISWLGIRKVTPTLSSDTKTSLDSNFELLKRWREIEITLRNVIAAQSGESTAKESISALIESLGRQDLLPQEDIIKMRQVLRVRNQVAHSSSTFEERELDNALADADSLLEKLRVLV